MEEIEGKIVYHEPKKKSSVTKNPWIFVSIVLGLACGILLLMTFTPELTGNVVSGDEAGESLAEYLSGKVATGEVTYISSEDQGDLYKVLVEYQDEEIPVYITKDGKYFIQGVTPLDEAEQVQAPTQTPTQAQEPVEVTKSDKPKVELFVMTHCPYGTQAEKGIIPTIKALGDTVDAKIRFVHYFMHDPEETETPIQVCIREEQEDKFYDYLECFLVDGDSDRCLTEASIDTDSLDTCVAGEAEEYYAEDSALSQAAGVSGSPTLVVNGQIIRSGRDSASYLTAICSAFNTEPSECAETLSSASPSPGFGTGTSPSPSSSGGCGS